jgi:hypothetical protein
MDKSEGVLPLLGLLLVAVMVIGVLGLIVAILWNARRKLKAREQFLTGLGFTRLQPSPAFLQRMEAIYRRGSQQRFRLGALFEKQLIQGGSFYVFDLVETSGEENTWVASGSVAYISPELQLPRFHVSGRLAVEGKTGTWMVGMAEKVLDWAATRIGMTRLDLGEFSEIDERLMVLAQDETAALAFLTRERLGRLLWLAEVEHRSDVDCGGDCFVINRATPQFRGDMETGLRSLLDDARRVLTALA